MQTEKVIIANLKCGGCATTIRNRVGELPGVKKVDVNVEEDLVTVDGENISRKLITDKLHDLGYPEATEENGLLLQLKSYASCVIGRMNKT